MLERKANPLLLRLQAKTDPLAAYTASLPPAKRDAKLCRREAAAEALGELSLGMERHLLTKGEYCLVDMIAAVLKATGPAHMHLSTWTAHGRSIEEIHAMVQSCRLVTVRWLMDYTFAQRKPAFLESIRGLFGPNSLRVTSTHTNFAIIHNSYWNVCLFTSASLARNPRNEQFIVREDEGLACFYCAFVDDLFWKQDADACLETSKTGHKARFAAE